ncbi:hypothetical protein ACQY1Q_13770 [Tenacibaculum sp. TC6]|uniref:hypothetical protein n=1 Tax=Tenacibaculum sp. TC6 TaxID=3423223 RepID=UPI003D35CDC3
MKFIFSILLLFFISCNHRDTDELSNFSSEIVFNWIQKPTASYANENMNFILTGNLNTKNTYLFITNDYGNTIIEPTLQGNKLTFAIPSFFTKISGEFLFSLTTNGQIIDKGTVTIKPIPYAQLLETYCGPSYLVASDKDYSMLVVIPNDLYDNPNASGYFTSEMYNEKKIDKYVDNHELLGYSNINSKEKKGKIFVKAYTDSIKSKTLELSILANNPVNFTITYHRNTSFADGKELTTLKTSVIKDIYGNSIENGTLVSFYMTTNDSIYMKAYGSTINGIATAKFVHPTEEKKYTVKAYVENFSSSNSLIINYIKANY